MLSGPSGAGKSTLLKKLFQEHGSIFGFSVSRECLRTLKGKELRGYPSMGLFLESPNAHSQSIRLALLTLLIPTTFSLPRASI